MGTTTNPGVTDQDADVQPSGPSPSERDLLEGLFRSEQQTLLRVARLLVTDRARAEELVQDAFVRVHGRLADKDNPAAYLQQTLINLCRDHRRRESTARRHPPAPPGTAPPPDLPPSTSAAWLALQDLPERQREALVLRFYADLSTDDIARVLDARPGTIRSLLHRGITALREVVPHD